MSSGEAVVTLGTANTTCANIPSHREAMDTHASYMDILVCESLYGRDEFGRRGRNEDTSNSRRLVLSDEL